MNSDTSSTARILVVDDDPGIREAIGDFLIQHGFGVSAVDSAAAMDRHLASAPVDIVVLDVMMPGEDGLSACRRVAANPSLGVIMLSAMGSDTDRIVGIEVGADDYLAKPCNPRELLARIRAVLRRRQAGADRVAPGQLLEFGGWTLNSLRRELTSPSGAMLKLTEGEFTMLRVLVEHSQRILTRDQLLDYARGPDSDAFDRAIDVQISRLRRKLSVDGGEEIIRTVRNEGYMLVPRVSRR